MQRLAQFLHDIVGDIHDVGNGIAANQCQATAHPCRGRLDLHIIHIMCAVTRAEIRRIYGYGKAFLYHIGCSEIGCRFLHFLAQNSSNFSCNAENALAVRTVCCDGNIKNPVIQTGNLLDIRTDFRILRQLQQAVIACARIQVLIQTQLNTGAQHTKGFIAAQLALFNGSNAFNGHMILSGCINGCTNHCQRILASGLNVIRTTANLQQFAGTGIDLAQMQMGFRNRLAGLHVADNNLADVTADLILLLHLKAAGEQLFLQLIRCYINIYIFF